MVKLVTDEQTVKRPSQFLKVKDGSEVILASNLVKLVTHYIESRRKSVICSGDDCYFCSKNVSFRNEYFYYANVDGEDGVLRLPASVFYSINDSERLLKKSKREFSWLISKQGEGLKTKYTVTRGSDVKVDNKKIQANNKNLLAAIDRYEKSVIFNYDSLMADTALLSSLEDEREEVEVPDEVGEIVNGKDTDE